MKFIPHPYQIEAARHLAKRPFCALLADPGTGKTAILLAVLRGLKKQNPKHRALVITTRRIMYEVWPNEIAKWDQFKGLTFEILHGPKKLEAARRPADIHIMNVDGLKWASKNAVLFNYDTLIIDESSKLKNWVSKRMKLLKKYLGEFTRRHILTGSPMPNSLQDYFAQQYIVDQGLTLGQFITPFRQRYFFDNAPPGAMYSTWIPRQGATREVLTQVAPFACRLDGEELLDLPDIVINDIVAPFPESLFIPYAEALADSESAGAAFMLARQLANGYLVGGSEFHSAKMEVLETLVDELNGRPLLVFFNFRAEGEAIARRYNCPIVYGGTKDRDVADVVARWNAKELPIVCMNPATTGHGLNLQDGGYHMVWFSLPTNQDDYFQAIRRLRRMGQKSKSVFVHRILVDLEVEKVLVDLLDGKTDRQRKFLDGIKERTENAKHRRPREILAI